MKTVAIVGSAITEENLLTKLKPEWEVWSVNNLYTSFPNVKFTRWFELHHIKRIKNIYTRRGSDTYMNKSVNDYMKDINALNIPVMMQTKWKIIRKSERFPFKNVIKQYGIYFGCSFAWMMGYILLTHQMSRIDKIYFYGIELNGHEYYFQRPSTEYMIGIATGQKIKIHIDTTSSLLKEPYIYAYKEDFDLIEFLHIGFMKDVVNTIGSAITQYFMMEGKDETAF